MDKASIVGDAVLYVQELQSQAKKLKADIAGLEASLNSTGGYQEPAPDAHKTRRGLNPPVSKKIIQVLNQSSWKHQNLVHKAEYQYFSRTNVGDIDICD